MISVLISDSGLSEDCFRMSRLLGAGLVVFSVLFVPYSLFAQAPTLPPNSVVNGASFRGATEPGGAIAPGTIISAFGSNLATATQEAMSVPLSTRLPDNSGGSSLIFIVGSNQIEAPLFFVAAGQINAQTPFNVPAGTHMVQVRRGSETSAAQPVVVRDVSPGIFIMDPATNRGAVVNAQTFQLITDSNRTRPGDFLSIFCTGLGAVDPPVPSGQRAPSAEPLARTVSQPLVNIGGIPAQVIFSGLAPGFVGLYQVNVQVPMGVPSGTQPLEIVINGVPSNRVNLAVQ